MTIIRRVIYPGSGIRVPDELVRSQLLPAEQLNIVPTPLGEKVALISHPPPGGGKGKWERVCRLPRIWAQHRRAERKGLSARGGRGPSTEHSAHQRGTHTVPPAWPVVC
jgi:hypothetical protein